MRRRWWTRQGRTILNEFTGEINEYSDDDDDGGDANEESSAGLPESVAARVGVINLLVLILADPDTVARRGHRRAPQRGLGAGESGGAAGAPGAHRAAGRAGPLLALQVIQGPPYGSRPVVWRCTPPTDRQSLAPQRRWKRCCAGCTTPRRRCGRTRPSSFGTSPSTRTARPPRPPASDRQSGRRGPLVSLIGDGDAHVMRRAAEALANVANHPEGPALAAFAEAIGPLVGLL